MTLPMANPSLTCRLRAFANNEQGATAIEYALVASIAVAIIAIVDVLGSVVLDNLFLKIATKLTGGGSGN